MWNTQGSLNFLGNTSLLIKMLNFWTENILNVPTNGKGIPYNNMTPCKLSILRENAHEM